MQQQFVKRKQILRDEGIFFYFFGWRVKRRRLLLSNSYLLLLSVLGARSVFAQNAVRLHMKVRLWQRHSYSSEGGGFDKEQDSARFVVGKGTLIFQLFKSELPPPHSPAVAVCCIPLCCPGWAATREGVVMSRGLTTLQ